MSRQVFKSILLSLIFYALLYVPIAGPAEIYAAHPSLFTIEGITVDHEGTVYAAVVAIGGVTLGRVMRIPALHGFVLPYSGDAKTCNSY